jgi:phospholipase/carboxylesterase
MTAPNPNLHSIANLPTRLRNPVAPSGGLHPALIMLHGHRGSEDVAWIFARGAAAHWFVAAPRAPYPQYADDGSALGFSWYTFSEAGRSDPATYQAGLSALRQFVQALLANYPIDPSRLYMLGFSQGAAMSYAYALDADLLTLPLAGLVALGGFIPGTVSKPYPPRPQLPVLILHGSQDEVIPVGLAHKSRDTMTELGADVTYLEEPVGHRVGTGGMRLLNTWLADRA